MILYTSEVTGQETDATNVRQPFDTLAILFWIANTTGQNGEL